MNCFQLTVTSAMRHRRAKREGRGNGTSPTAGKMGFLFVVSGK